MERVIYTFPNSFSVCNIKKTCVSVVHQKKRILRKLNLNLYKYNPIHPMSMPTIHLSMGVYSPKNRNQIKLEKEEKKCNENVMLSIGFDVYMPFRNFGTYRDRSG